MCLKYTPILSMAIQKTSFQLSSRFSRRSNKNFTNFIYLVHNTNILECKIYNNILIANIVNHHRIQHQNHPLHLHRIAAACCVCTLNRQPRGRRHPHQTPWCTKADLHQNYNLSLLHRPNRDLQNNSQKRGGLTSRTTSCDYVPCHAGKTRLCPSAPNGSTHSMVMS